MFRYSPADIARPPPWRRRYSSFRPPLKNFLIERCRADWRKSRYTTLAKAEGSSVAWTGTDRECKIYLHIVSVMIALIMVTLVISGMERNGA